MSRVLLFPRLSPIEVDAILSRMSQGGPKPALDLHDLEESMSVLSYAASGGSIAKSLAVTVSNDLRSLASAHGFPHNSTARKRAEFDCHASILLANKNELRTGEALRDDVWACLTTVMAPDVVAWRFPDLSTQRFHGGVRNAFQRLWVRGIALDRGAGHEERWGLLEMLTEDAMVQIFERASLSGNVSLAGAIAEAWATASLKYSKEAMEGIMRSAIKLIRLRNEIVDLSVLDSRVLIDEIGNEFTRAAEWRIG